MVVVFQVGCVMDEPVVHRDDSLRIKTLGEESAHADLQCSKVESGRPIRSVRLTEGSEPLFSEYRIWIEGCGKHITYVFVCRDDDDMPCQSTNAEKALLKE